MNNPAKRKAPSSDEIGSGLAVEHSTTDAVRPRWMREGPAKYRAEISGIVNGSRVVRWASPETYATAAQAQAAAEARGAQ